MYVTLNDGTSRVQVLTDTGADIAVQTLYTPAQADQNYCAASLMAGADGTLYFTNDSGLLFALKGSAPSGTDDGGHTPDIPKTGERDVVPMAWMLLAMGAGVCWLCLRREQQH